MWCAWTAPCKKASDYVYTRETVHTGDVLGPDGEPAAKILDIAPHEFTPRDGLKLAGPNTFGSYPTDGGGGNQKVTMGCLQLPAVGRYNVF